MNKNISITFPLPLQRMIFVERPNRFILHCYLEETKSMEIVHLADPGRLKELLVNGVGIYVLPSTNPNRKTKWTAVLVEHNECFVSINTTFPNMIVEKMMKESMVEELATFHWIKSEYTYKGSRWDFLLENQEGKKLVLEVKSVTLAENGIGMFPDAVTARGTKHIKELIEINKEGNYDTAVLFIVQREDVEVVTTAPHIDYKFAEAINEAERNGVKFLAYTCRLSEKEIQLYKSVPVDTKLSSHPL